MDDLCGKAFTALLRGYGKKDSQLDYLSGNAGAIVMAVMLYKETEI